MPAAAGHGLAAAVGFGAVVGTAAILASLVTVPEIPGWYHSLTQPGFTPPDWLFGPVWTVLYLMIAASGWLVWRRRGFRGARAGFSVFALQLALNTAWSFLFFGLHRPGLALADMAGLWVAIAATGLLFGRTSRVAAALLIPYLAWVSYAAALNAAIWTLN